MFNVFFLSRCKVTKKYLAKKRFFPNRSGKIPKRHFFVLSFVGSVFFSYLCTYYI